MGNSLLFDSSGDRNVINVLSKVNDFVQDLSREVEQAVYNRTILEDVIEYNYVEMQFDEKIFSERIEIKSIDFIEDLQEEEFIDLTFKEKIDEFIDGFSGLVQDLSDFCNSELSEIILEIKILIFRMR